MPASCSTHGVQHRQHRIQCVGYSVLHGLGQRDVLGQRWSGSRVASRTTRTITHARARSSSKPAASTSVSKRRRTPSRMLTGELVPAVPQHRRDLVVRIAVHGPGTDREPPLTVGREHVPVVKVAVDDAAGRFVSQLAAQHDRLLDESVRDRGAAR